MMTLILPAEIRSREMDGRILHAVLAVSRGWRVILGSKAHINRAIWKFPRGVYLFTTLTTKRTTMAKLLKSMGFVSQGWDEEGLIYSDREVYITRRISLDTVRLVDQIFTWGDVGTHDMSEKISTIGKEAIAIGNPRFDLLRPELRQLHMAEADAIQNKYGPFILINTNFSSVNPVLPRKDFPLRPAPRETKDASPAAIAKYNDFIDFRRKMFQEFQEVIPVLAAAFAHVNIVVRPHPVEDLRPWKKLAAHFPNVCVVREGPSIPWLMAAKALVHNGCTTGVEMRLLGGEPVSYEPIPNTADSPLPNSVSHKTKTVEKLVETLRAVLAGACRATTEQMQILRQYVSAIDGKLAAERALDHAERLAKNLPTVGAAAQTTRAYAALRHTIKSCRLNHKTDRYLAKVFPETSEEYVLARAQKISEVLGLEGEDNIEVRKVDLNVFMMSRKLP